MSRSAATVEQYLSSLPADRRALLEDVRQTIRRNLDPLYEEGMQYGMIGWYVPHRVFPDGYHCDPKQPLPFAGLAAQKKHCSLYFMGIYGDPKLRAWFEKAWLATGRELDMGRACIRFASRDAIALDVVGEAVKKMPARAFIASYVAQRPTPKGASKPAKSATTETKTAAKKSIAKPTKRPTATIKAKPTTSPKKTTRRR